MPVVLNRSSVVTDEEAARMAAACDVQLVEHFCPEWELAPWRVRVNTRAFIHMVLVDEDRDVPGALAYHDMNGDRPVGVVMAKTVLDSGGSMFGPGGVAAALSHEILETRADPWCSFGVEDGRGWEWWLEVCDAVQSTDYAIDGVHVSNYCLKDWFVPGRDSGRYDRLGQLSAPFTIDRGGYQVRRQPGSESQVTGKAPAFHGWRTLKRVGL